MTLDEALGIVAPPGRDRYRQLCDPAHPDYDPRYIPIVMAKADAVKSTGIYPPVAAPPSGTDRPSVAESASLIAAMNACPYRAVWPKCGCSGARCGLRGHEIVSRSHAIVSHVDCVACVKAYG